MISFRFLPSLSLFVAFAALLSAAERPDPVKALVESSAGLDPALRAEILRQFSKNSSFDKKFRLELVRDAALSIQTVLPTESTRPAEGRDFLLLRVVKNALDIDLREGRDLALTASYLDPSNAALGSSTVADALIEHGQLEDARDFILSRPPAEPFAVDAASDLCSRSSSLCGGLLDAAVRAYLRQPDHPGLLPLFQAAKARVPDELFSSSIERVIATMMDRKEKTEPGKTLRFFDAKSSIEIPANRLGLFDFAVFVSQVQPAALAKFRDRFPDLADLLDRHPDGRSSLKSMNLASAPPAQDQDYMTLRQARDKAPSADEARQLIEKMHTPATKADMIALLAGQGSFKDLDVIRAIAKSMPAADPDADPPTTARLAATWLALATGTDHLQAAELTAEYLQKAMAALAVAYHADTDSEYRHPTILPFRTSMRGARELGTWLAEHGGEAKSGLLANLHDPNLAGMAAAAFWFRLKTGDTWPEMYGGSPHVRRNASQ